MTWMRRLFGKPDDAGDRRGVGHDSVREGSNDASDVSSGSETVLGERHIPSVSRVRSLQSRVSGALAVGLVSFVGLGFLGWYYSQALTRGERTQHAAERVMLQRAQGETDVPPLGPIEPPRVVALDAQPAETDSPAGEPVASRVLGAPPPPPDLSRRAGSRAAQSVAMSADTSVLERRLTGPVLVTIGSPSEQPHGDGRRIETSAETMTVGQGNGAYNATEDELASLLKPTVIPAAQARLLPDQHLLLGKSTPIDCTLETAIDTSLQGFVKCITATDTFSADGSVVLIARGSRLFGETRGQVRRGRARVFVLWTEARSDGVVTPLESPGTDELGRTGLPGKVNHHFFERFGAAFLTSIVEGAVQAAVQSESEGAVIVNPSTSSQVMTEVLRNTINLAPTVLKPQGDRLQVMVARDVDFRSVYALRVREQ